MSYMTVVRLLKVTAILALAILSGCVRGSKREEHYRGSQVALSKIELPPPSSDTISDNSCGLDDFPVSKSTEEILTAVPSEAAPPPNQMMMAKVAVSSEGKVTHLRVIRLAWPKLPNSRAINTDTIEAIKHWRYKPTIVDGRPVAVCSEISVTVDLW